MIDRVDIFCSFPDSDAEAVTNLFFHHEKGYVELHQEFINSDRITRAEIRELLLDFEELKGYIKSLGFNRIFTGSINADDKMKRYWEMMGFRKVEDFPVAVIDI